MTTIWQKIKQKLSRLKSKRICTQSKACTKTKDSAHAHLQHSPEPVSNFDTEHSSSAHTDGDRDTSKDHSKYTVPNHTHKKSAHPITDIIAAYLTTKGWKFTHFPPKDSSKSPMHHLSLGMQSDDMEWGYLFRINENNKLLSVYGILPFSLSPEQISAGVALATQVNYDLMIGNVEIDLRDGEIRFKNAIDTECIELTEDVLDYLTQSITAMTHIIYKLFYELYQGQSEQQSLEELLTQIQEMPNANAYFLASERIQ